MTTKLALREKIFGKGVQRRSRPEGSYPTEIDRFPPYVVEVENSFGPIFRLVSEFISPRIKKGSHVMDLSGGIGSFPTHFAQIRKDIRMHGFIPTLAHLNGARDIAKKRGLQNIQFVKDDPKNFLVHLTDRVTTLVMVLGQANYGYEKDLKTCLNNMKAACERVKCQIFIFDFSRPRNSSTMSDVTYLFSKTPSVTLKKEILSAMEGAWTYAEMNKMLDFIEYPGLGHWPGKKFQLFHAHTNMNSLYWEDHKKNWTPSVFSRRQIETYETFSPFMPF